MIVVADFKGWMLEYQPPQLELMLRGENGDSRNQRGSQQPLLRYASVHLQLKTVLCLQDYQPESMPREKNRGYKQVVYTQGL